MKITFFITRLDMRVLRMALAAKEAGIVLQLFSFNKVEPLLVPVPQPFSDIVYYENAQGIQKLIGKATDFGSELVHAFASCNTNANLVHLCHYCKLPIVGDAYDMMNVQYVQNIYNTGLMNNIATERQWLDKVDALCLRSRYVKLLKSAQLYHVGKNVMYLPEPYEPRLAVDRVKLSSKSGGTHILFMIDHSLADGDAHYFVKMIRSAQEANIYFHILEWPSIKVPARLKDYFEKKFPNIFIHEFMDFNKYIELVARMDIITQNTDFYACLNKNGAYGTYRLDAAPYFFANKVNEALECNALYMVPEFFKAQGDYALKGGRGLVFGQCDLTNEAFWKGLAERVPAMTQKPVTGHHISTGYQGKRLLRFYEKVIANKKLKNT